MLLPRLIPTSIAAPAMKVESGLAIHVKFSALALAQVTRSQPAIKRARG